MPNVRMIPPGTAVGSITTSVGARSYTCAVNSYLDVPDFDGRILEANGWIKVADVGSGTTAQRVAFSALSAPGSLNKGDEWHDTTLGYIVVYDGNSWHRPDTGAVV